MCYFPYIVTNNTVVYYLYLVLVLTLNVTVLFIFISSYLPSTIIGPVSSIHLMALYRKIAANILLERTSFDSAGW